MKPIDFFVFTFIAFGICDVTLFIVVGDVSGVVFVLRDVKSFYFDAELRHGRKNGDAVFRLFGFDSEK